MAKSPERDYESIYAFQPGHPLSCDSVSLPQSRRKLGKLFWGSAGRQELALQQAENAELHAELAAARELALEVGALQAALHQESASASRKLTAHVADLAADNQRLHKQRTMLAKEYCALEERLMAEQAMHVQLQLLQERVAALYAQLQESEVGRAVAAAQQLEALQELGSLQSTAHASEQEAWLLTAELQRQLAAAQKLLKQARAIASDSFQQPTAWALDGSPVEADAVRQFTAMVDMQSRTERELMAAEDSLEASRAELVAAAEEQASLETSLETVLADARAQDERIGGLLQELAEGRLLMRAAEAAAGLGLRTQHVLQQTAALQAAVAAAAVAKRRASQDAADAARAQRRLSAAALAAAAMDICAAASSENALQKGLGGRFLGEHTRVFFLGAALELGLIISAAQAAVGALQEEMAALGDPRMNSPSQTGRSGAPSPAQSTPRSSSFAPSPVAMGSPFGGPSLQAAVLSPAFAEEGPKRSWWAKLRWKAFTKKSRQPAPGAPPPLSPSPLRPLRVAQFESPITGHFRYQRFNPGTI